MLISIHAPREGRDSRNASLRVENLDFNPRAPRGARQQGCDNGRGRSLFQSTRPARGATRPLCLLRQPA